MEVFGLGLTEIVLILLGVLVSLAVCAMFVVGMVLIVRPLMRPRTDAGDQRRT